MEWNEFLEKYQSQENFDEQIDFLKLYHGNYVLLEQLKQHFYEFWKSTKFELPKDYQSLLYMIGAYPSMNRILKKYLYLILLDTWDKDLSLIIQLLIELDVEIEIDSTFESFLNDYLLQHSYHENRNLIKVLDLKEKQEKYYYLLIEQQLDYLLENNETCDNSKYSKNIYREMIDLLIVDLKNLAVKEEVEDTIHYLGSGGYAEVFRIGKYVLKIGSLRFYSMNETMDSPYLNYRLFYKEFKDYNLCIEITPYADVQSITKEDVQEMYNKNREAGYFWLDPKPINMGILVYDTENLFGELTPLGRTFLGAFPFHLQNAGTKVIIDLDYYLDFRKFSNTRREQEIKSYLDYYFDDWDNIYEKSYQQQKIKK